LKDFSRVCIQCGVAENLSLPRGLAEIAQDIRQKRDDGGVKKTFTSLPESSLNVFAD
jgi:hypothetical protein